MKASLRNIRISPKKLNVLATLVRGSNAKEAAILLAFTPKKGAKILKKVIESALANAENNFKQNPDALAIKEIKVSKAFNLKRHIAGSRGRARPILKRSAHMHLELAISEKPAPKKPKAAKATETTEASTTTKKSKK